MGRTTKQARLTRQLSTAEEAGIDEMMKLTGWKKLNEPRGFVPGHQKAGRL